MKYKLKKSGDDEEASGTEQFGSKYETQMDRNTTRAILVTNYGKQRQSCRKQMSQARIPACVRCLNNDGSNTTRVELFDCFK